MTLRGMLASAVTRGLRRIGLLDYRYSFPRRVAGIHVDEESAKTFSAVFACVRIITQSIAVLPWNVYIRDGEERKPFDNSPAAWLLGVQANPEMSAGKFREALLPDALLSGNGYAEIERDMAGRPMWMWPIGYRRILDIWRSPSEGLLYEVDTGGPRVQIPSRDMFHLHGLGNGLAGDSVVGMAAKCIGLGLAMEKFGASFFENGASPGLVVKHPKVFNDVAYQRFKDSLNDGYGGSKAGSTLLLEDGAELAETVVSMPMTDAQFLETRRFQVVEVCRWFGVPPHRVAELERATNNNIEHQAIELVTDAILPWCKRLEDEANIKLFGAINRGRAYTKLNLAGALRGDLKTRYEAYQIGRNGGWLSADEIRAWEDLNPIPGGKGKIYVMQAQMTPLDMLGKTPVAKAPPAAGAPGAEDEDPNKPEDEEEEGDA